MPKEIICPVADDKVVRVGWSIENVQVATLDKVDDNSNSGWYVSLGRHDINNLIRVLRRARDAAFGADA